MEYLIDFFMNLIELIDFLRDLVDFTDFLWISLTLQIFSRPCRSYRFFLHLVDLIDFSIACTLHRFFSQSTMIL